MEIVIFIKNILLYYNYIYNLILLTVFEITQKVAGWLSAPSSKFHWVLGGWVHPPSTQVHPGYPAGWIFREKFCAKFFFY